MHFLCKSRGDRKPTPFRQCDTVPEDLLGKEPLLIQLVPCSMQQSATLIGQRKQLSQWCIRRQTLMDVCVSPTNITLPRAREMATFSSRAAMLSVSKARMSER